VSDKEVKINLNVKKDDDGGQTSNNPRGASHRCRDRQGRRQKSPGLGADLEDLRQTLLRRQADFDNYRKRVEKERFEDSKRAHGSCDRRTHSP